MGRGDGQAAVAVILAGRGRGRDCGRGGHRCGDRWWPRCLRSAAVAPARTATTAFGLAKVLLAVAKVAAVAMRTVVYLVAAASEVSASEDAAPGSTPAVVATATATLDSRPSYLWWQPRSTPKHR